MEADTLGRCSAFCRHWSLSQQCLCSGRVAGAAQLHQFSAHTLEVLQLLSLFALNIYTAAAQCWDGAGLDQLELCEYQENRVVVARLESSYSQLLILFFKFSLILTFSGFFVWMCCQNTCDPMF